MGLHSATTNRTCLSESSEKFRQRPQEQRYLTFREGEGTCKVNHREIPRMARRTREWCQQCVDESHPISHPRRREVAPVRQRRERIEEGQGQVENFQQRQKTDGPQGEIPPSVGGEIERSDLISYHEKYGSESGSTESGAGGHLGDARCRQTFAEDSGHEEAEPRPAVQRQTNPQIFREQARRRETERDRKEDFGSRAKHR